MREARERLQGLESEFPCASWLPVVSQNPAESSLVSLKTAKNSSSISNSIFPSWRNWRAMFITAITMTTGIIGM
ncbi:hypothetical protein PL11201_530196 [Planktothrix sp. PCC 11201]|uniref:hypothetical protein n=1 Tax=Planktothrix sp. PCC 11201 TaxID=1729650 RepID=UPI00091600F1|nr:hypothetical protein [Planktothrix sp. PCC 11201]SKB13866.1 hypothetical protein PL11201_530196 [Planktothrix sp. PCC 11201]